MVNQLVEGRDAFVRLFGAGPGEIRVFFAPGRVNLIGEHLDYNGGQVLPAALEMGVCLIVRPRTDGVFRFASSAYAGVVEVRDRALAYDPSHGFANYPKGVLQYLREEGGVPEGLDCFFDSNLPSGAGLSSSAAIEVVTAYAAASLANHSMSLTDIARVAQKAENRYVGVECGIMDQFAVSVGKPDMAILLDCQTEEFQYAPTRFGSCALIILNSNKPRKLSDSLYNQRRQECRSILAQIKTSSNLPIHYLADLSHAVWEDVQNSVSDPVLKRRVEHVVSESQRVREAVARLAEGNMVGFGKLLNQSHQSLAENYEVTGPELDGLVDAAQKAPGSMGARMTGAGFGGCAISLVERDALGEFVRHVRGRYIEEVGYEPTFYESRAGGGVREITKG